MVPTSSAEPPLCVDLDGTLIAGDTLWISFLGLMLRRPWLLPLAIATLPQGRSCFKSRVFDLVGFDPVTLSYHEDVIEFLRDQKRNGRQLILATAADRRIGQAVAAHLQLFDSVIGSEPGHNLKGEQKVKAIRQHLQSAEFDYMGDSRADLPLFRAARKAYLVRPSASVLRAARAVTQVERVFAGQARGS